MKNTTRIVTFDIETTGTNPERDQIIEICFQHGLAADSESFVWRIKPSVSISPEAQAVHGISIEDLKDCKPFKDHAAEIRQHLEAADILVAYNINFDVSFVSTEFRRNSLPAVDLSRTLLVDPYQLWTAFEPRNLSAAHEKFVGGEFAGAHSAREDVAATARVLSGMLLSFGLAEASWDEIAGYCKVNRQRKNCIGPSTHFVWNGEKPIFNFGKHASREILQVAKEDQGSYLRWLAAKDFPQHVKQIAHAAVNKSPDEFLQWLSGEFGQAPK